MVNDNYGKQVVNWSSKRNNADRLRHRPHVVTSANNRGSANVRYFSSVDADIYYGGTFIDEVVSISWQVQQNAMPIFGYNSYTFDDMAIGNRIVQGQFAVNFTESNYLTTVQQTFKKISRKMYGADLAATSAFIDEDRIRRNTPIWDAGFDIMVGYGEKTNDHYEQIAILDCCQLTGCAQQLDYNGEPITEVYSFIARDIKFSQVATGATVTPEDNDTDLVPEYFDDMKVANSSILINNSNKFLSFEHDQGDSASSAKLTIDLDGGRFGTGIELTCENGKMSASLTDVEKKLIADYCAKYSYTKVQGNLSCSLTNNGQARKYSCIIIFNVTI